jgi:diguanylate cyclase (GGDEF)-like protein/PAS domain S-box-containing protein
VHVRRRLARANETIRETAVEREQFEEYLELAGAMIVILDPTGRIRGLNQKSVELLGAELGDVRGEDWYSVFVPEETREPIRRRFLSLMSGAEGEEGRAQYSVITRSGEELHTMWYRRVLRSDDGQVTGLLSVGFDDTDRRSREQELNTRAVRDELTALYNRRGFGEVATQVLALAKRSHRDAHVFFADVNNLKEINDTQGHAAGDAALIAAAECLRGIFRTADVIARVGGDEFAILTIARPHETDEHVDRLKQRIKHACAGEALPAEVSLSVGVCEVDLDDPNGLETAIVLADKSMYSAKRARVPEGAHDEG